MVSLLTCILSSIFCFFAGAFVLFAILMIIAYVRGKKNNDL